MTPSPGLRPGLTEPAFQAGFGRCTPRHRNRDWISWFTAASCLLALAALLFASGVHAQTPDPLGVKWTTLPSDTKPADLAERDGISIELSRKDLEDRLARLRKTLDADKTPPRLLKTSYRAELVGNDLVGGGQWLIDQPGTGILWLPDLSFALRKPRLDGKDAILGDLDGKRLGLRLDKAAAQTLLFDWSQRGVPTTSGVAFELHLPAAPMIELEIRLPADQTLAQGKSVGLLTGPHDTGNPAMKSWRLETTGRAAIELIVHRGSDTGRPSAVFASRKTRVQFSPESSQFEHDFQLEVLHTPLRELVFDVDPMLEPYEVTSRQTPIKGWRVEPPADRSGDKAKARSRLRVQLREPLLGIMPELRIRSAGPRWPDKETSLPDIALAKAISRGETLKLVFHPEQFLESWNPGSFRIEQLATEDDGSQSIGLVDTQPEGGGSRPTFLLRAPTLEFAVRQESRWRLTTTGSELTSDLHYDVSRGRLFEPQLRLPKSGVWRVVSVKTEPEKEKLRKSGVAGSIVSVELNNGISPRKDLRLRVRLQSTRDGSKSAPAFVDFPDLEPLGAKVRQGTLAIIADAPYQMSLVQSSQPPIRVEPTESKEPRDPHLDWFFTYRQTPLTGKLRLVPQAPVVRVHAREEILLSGDRAQTDARLELEPIVGQPSFVDVWLTSAEDTFQVEVEGAELQSRERLHARELAPWTLQLGAGTPMARAFARLSYPPGQAWRLHFRQPLQEAATLRIRYGASRSQGRAPPGASMSFLPIDLGLPLVAAAVATRLEQRGLLPIAVVPGAEWTDGEVTVESAGVLIGKTYGAGLEPIGPATANAPTRTFRFRDTAGLPTLGVVTTPRLGVESAQAVIDRAELTTSVDKTGNVLQELRIRVRNWRAREFPVIVPPGSDVLAVRSDGIDVERLASRASSDGIEIPIATAPSEGSQWLELSYRTPAKSVWGGLGIDPYAPEPRLPIPVLSWRTSLRLDRAWLPLNQERYASLERRALGQETLRAAWQAGEGIVEEIVPSSNPAWLDKQRFQMSEAESDTRKKLGPDATLGEAFSRLVLDAPKSADGLVVVLDRTALRATGATPRTKVPPGPQAFWETLGLVYVPTPKGALLTSRDRAERWTAAVRSGGVLGATLIANVGRAAEFGQDGSGRFVAVDAWLRTDGTDTRPPVDESREMSTWLPTDDFEQGGDLLLHRGRIRWTACLAAIVALVLGAALRRASSAATFFRAIWIGVALVVLGLVVAPWALWELLLAPLVSLMIFLVVAYWDVRRSISKPPPSVKGPPRSAKSTQKALRASLGCGLALVTGTLLVHAVGAQVADPELEARTAYILAGTRVFVRPEFVRWLETAERDAQPATADAVFLAANYAGSWDGQRGVFQVDFDVHAFRGKTMLTVPLVGVDLLDGSFLDGSPAYPTVAAAGKVGYQLPIATAGTHRLTMAFAVRAPMPGDLRFSIPQTPDTNLRWTMPARLGQPQSLRGSGAESLRPEPRSQEQVLDSQLGRENGVHLHWASGSGSAGPGAMQVRELYFWDLRAGQRSATGVLAYRPTGPVSQVELQISPRLEPRAVEATAGTSSIVKSWRVIGGDGNRLLQIDLLKPTTTPFQVQLALVPRGGTTARVDELRLPLPLRAVPVQGHLAFRIDEPEFRERTQFVGMTEVPIERFVKEWTALGTREIAVPVKAYSFVRAAKSAAAALVEITETPRPPHVEVAAVCTLGPQGFDVDAKLTIRSPDQLDVLPLRLPAGFALGDVNGADVHHWSRSGDVLQVWLKQPAPREPTAKDAAARQPWSVTTLVLLGHVPVPAADKKVTLTAPTMIGAVIDSIALTPQSLGSWGLSPKSPVKERLDELGRTRYVLPAPQTSLEFALKPQVVAPTYRSLTAASVQGGVATVATHVRGLCETGDWPELQVRVVGWPAGTPRLHAPGFPHKTKHARQGGDHVWTITFPPGTPQQATFSIGGRFPVDAGQDFAMPEVRIERGGVLTAATAAAVALVGAQPIAKLGGGWAELKRPGEDLAVFPSDLARLRKTGALFLARSADAGPLRVQPRETPTTAATKVLDARYSVLPAAPGRWLHRMTWELATKGRQEIDIRLPDRARLAAAFVAGRVTASRNADPQIVTLPLPAAVGPLGVEICWTYPEAGEDFERPRLDPAKAVDLDAAPALSTINVPAGWRLSGPAESLADTLLDEVRIRNQALAILADNATDEAGKAAASRALRDAAGLLRHAQYRVRLAESTKPAGQGEGRGWRICRRSSGPSPIGSASNRCDRRSTTGPGTRRNRWSTPSTSARRAARKGERRCCARGPNRSASTRRSRSAFCSSSASCCCRTGRAVSNAGSASGRSRSPPPRCSGSRSRASVSSAASSCWRRCSLGPCWRRAGSGGRLFARQRGEHVGPAGTSGGAIHRSAASIHEPTAPDAPIGRSWLTANPTADLQPKISCFRRPSGETERRLLSVSHRKDPACVPGTSSRSPSSASSSVAASSLTKRSGRCRSTISSSSAASPTPRSVLTASRSSTRSAPSTWRRTASREISGSHRPTRTSRPGGSSRRPTRATRIRAGRRTASRSSSSRLEAARANSGSSTSPAARPGSSPPSRPGRRPASGRATARRSRSSPPSGPSGRRSRSPRATPSTRRRSTTTPRTR